MGVNHLSVSGTSDKMVTKVGHVEQSQQNKEERDNTCVFHSPGSCGIGLECQIQVIKVAQMDNCKRIDNITETVTGPTSCCDIILHERSQQIELTKIISIK